jgi:signal peptidase II
MLKRWLALAALIIAADQYSKWLVLATLQFGETVVMTPFFNWTLTFNPGAAFSFLAAAGGWQRWLFTLLGLGVSAWVVTVLRQSAGQRLLSFGLSLLLGGALGNVIDRFRFGAVVDFIQLHVGEHYWPAFNVADSAICVGVALILWTQLRQEPAATDTTPNTSANQESKP